MRTAIYTLYQRHEFARMRCLIAQALPSLNDQCRLHILINDEDCPDLRAHVAAASRYITIHWEGRNLGVAGGRNLLIRRAVEAGAELMMAADNDIIYEASYFERLREAYARIARSDPDIGFIQPVLLDGREVRRFFPVLDGARDWDELCAKLSTDFSSWREELWSTVKATCGGTGKAASTIMHSGISNIWNAHFGRPPSERLPRPWQRAGWNETYRTIHRTLRSDLPRIESVMDEGLPVRIASTAGGVSAFHRGVFEAVGGYDDIFNPFGYEDSEMGFRSTLAGRHNYLVPDVFVVHDVFMGETNRTVMSYARLGLLRGVELAHPGLAGEDFDFAFQQSALYCWRELFKLFADAIAAGRMSQADAAQEVPSFALSYVLDLVRGALHGLARRGDRSALPPFLALLRGYLEGDAEIADFRLPLGFGARFVAGCAIARRREDAGGSAIHSLFASNCRIEETTAAGKLTSRYFDLACVIRPAGERAWRATVDVQSNDQTYGIETTIAQPAGNAESLGSARIVKWKAAGKRYDFGGFSVEDVYPAATLHRSESWLPMFKAYLNRVTATAGLPGVAHVTRSLVRYLGPIPAPPVADAPRPAPARRPTGKKRILLFADSRGQHKPAGDDYPIFGERLAADPRLEVDLFLCPMKWTTTLDFLERFDASALAGYDHVILYTGIVDWSPRRLSSAIHDLYDNPAMANPDNLALNTRDYSRKIVNNKKKIFDEVFGAEAMARHFSAPMNTIYEGEQTINMYSMDMARRSLLPRLAAISNLIFITANRFVPGWNGDYRRQRPANIGAVVHPLSTLFAELLPPGRVIDLTQWSNDEAKVYTCDNLHLTRHGSDFVYERIMEIFGMAEAPAPEARRASPAKPSDEARPLAFVMPAGGFTGLRTPQRITPARKSTILARAGRRDFLATLVVGVRLWQDDDIRMPNLRFLLQWIDHHYGDLFDVLLVEQDAAPRLDLANLGAKPYMRHEFIYNPRGYNRGWGYNVAVRHFCDRAHVVALMDTDVLTGANFVREVVDCHTAYDAVSPYRNIYYTDDGEAAKVRRTRKLEGLLNGKKIRNPVTVSGGILIIRRDVFLSLKGFEQYVGYGCEDRSLDVTLFNYLDHERIRIAGDTYAHLYHPADYKERVRFDEILGHLNTHYGCRYDPKLGPYDFIHSRCSHVSKDATLRLMIDRAQSFGDRDLYQRPEEPTVNGIVRRRSAEAAATEVIFPPEFESVEKYPGKELYDDAPEPDSAELAQFYNAYKGKRCFIIGNGPSLNKHDLALLRDEFTFGVNSFFYKTRETGFRPFFYVVEDSSVMKENIEEIRRFEAPFKFFPTNYRALHPKQPNTFFFRMNRGFYEKSSPNYVVPRFSTDASQVLYCGQSVTYINLQLAYFMGFTEVYLIGMDFSYVIPPTHKRTGDILLSDTDDPNHFHQDYFGKGKTWKDPKLDRVALNYRMAKLVYEATGRRIYNATIGGNLELFDRVDYQSLFWSAGAAPAAAPAPGPAVSFADANALFRAGQYGEALSAYVALMEAPGDGPKFLYQRNAIDAYRRAGEAGQPCRPEAAAVVRKMIAADG